MNLMTLMEGRDAPLYHTTSINGAAAILKADRLSPATKHVIPNMYDGEQIKGVSLTRNYNFSREWGTQRFGMNYCVFEIDQAKLSCNYKIVPIDFWYNSLYDEEFYDGNYDGNKRRQGIYAEAEEFVIGAIEPLDILLKTIIIPKNVESYMIARREQMEEKRINRIKINRSEYDFVMTIFPNFEKLLSNPKAVVK
jgi:hypothetical protein